MKILLPFFFLLHFLTIVPVQANAKVEVYKVKKSVKGGEVVIYKDPTKHSKKVARIPSHARWIVRKSKKKKYGKHFWRKISWRNSKGWVMANNLMLDLRATRNAKKDKRCLKANARPKSCDK